MNMEPEMKRCAKNGDRRKSVACAALCALLLCAVLLVLLRVWPFGDGSLLTGDLNGQYIHYFAHFRAALREGQGFGYAMEKSLGGSMVGILAYYCSSPLNLVFLAVPVLYYDVAITVVFVLKTVLAAAFCAYFLTERFPRLGLRGVPLSLGYAFCAYLIVYLQNIMWHDVALLLPLVCCGILRIVRTGRPGCYAFWLGLSIFANFYIGYMACLFSVLYFLFEMVLALPDRGKGAFILRRGLVFGGSSLLAGGLSCVLLLPAMLDVAKNKGMSSGFRPTFTAEFSWEDFWNRFAPGSFERTYDILSASGGRSPMPNVYCGVLAVLGLVLFFVSRGVTRRQKLVGGTLLAVLLLSLYSTDCMLLWHGLVMPIWFYWRNSFLFSFWVVFLAAFALAEGTLTPRRAALGGGILAVWLVLCIPHGAQMFTANRWLLTVLLCAAFAAAVGVLWLGRRQWPRRAAVLALTALTAAELLLNSVWSLRQFEAYPHSGYQEYVTDGTAAVAAVSEAAPGAYRMEKDYFRSLNDDMSLGYYGITHFGSTQDNACVRLIQALGYHASTAALYSTDNTLFADSFFGIRYLLSKGEAAAPSGYVRTGLAAGSLEIYQNPCALPLAFAVTDAMRELSLDDYGEADSILLQNDLWQAMGGTGEVVNADGSTDFEALQSFADRAQSQVSASAFLRNYFSVELTLDKDGLVLLTLPCYDILSVTVDGEQCQPEQLVDSLCGLELTAGTHTITMRGTTPGLLLGSALSALSGALLIVWVAASKKRSKR